MFVGDKIGLQPNGGKIGTMKSYSIEFKQNIFIEKDTSKSCKNYPNTKFVSYDECDQAFVKKSLKQVYPLNPFWADYANENVTLNATYYNYHEINSYMFNLYSGATETECDLPCATTTVFSRMIYETNWPTINTFSGNYIDLTPSTRVLITKTEFPPFSLSMALASYGGSMGFWLGLGVVQVFQYIMQVVRRYLHCSRIKIADTEETVKQLIN